MYARYCKERVCGVYQMNTEAAAREEFVIQRIRSGDRAAFEELVTMYRNRGLSIAYNLVGNLEDAKDALQDAFIKVYLHIEGFRGQSKFSTWFHRIVVNASLDFLRKKKRAVSVLTESLQDNIKEGDREISDNSLGPARIAGNQELNRRLEDAIAGLSLKQRICFVLKHQNGLGVREIAEILRCRRSTVKVHLFRAAENLRRKMNVYLKE